MAAPVRGTQSFVGVMGEVWRRPSLTAMEIAWRWLPCAVCLSLIPVIGVLLGSLGMDIHFSPLLQSEVALFQSMSVFRPAGPLGAMSGGLMELWNTLFPLLRWLLPALFLLWNLIAAFGRNAVLRRFDPTLHVRRLTLFVLGALRALALVVFWLLEWKLLVDSLYSAIAAPAARGEEAHLVTFAARIICGTLLLYVVWGVFSWFLQLAPLLAMRNNLGALAALRAALGSSRGLRGKLIEINLVMNIVRITLIVLAMVMSASPLAFQSVATQQFFAIWWGIAVLLYLAASDYFHVVRSAAYLSLHRVYNLPPAS
jgi:hypothetical protein